MEPFLEFTFEEASGASTGTDTYALEVLSSTTAQFRNDFTRNGTVYRCFGETACMTVPASPPTSLHML